MHRDLSTLPGRLRHRRGGDLGVASLQEGAYVVSEALHVEVAFVNGHFYGRLFKREHGVIKTTVWICHHSHTSFEDARSCAREERKRREGK